MLTVSLTITFSCLYFQVLAEKLPELLDFPKDLVSLEAATKVPFFFFNSVFKINTSIHFVPLVIIYLQTFLDGRFN